MATRLRFELPGSQALLAQETHLANAGLFVPDVQPPPEVDAVVTLRICSPFAADIELQGRVVQVFPGTGFALLPLDLEGARGLLAPAFAAARAAPQSDAPPQVSWEEDDAGAEIPELALDDLLVEDDDSDGDGGDDGDSDSDSDGDSDDGDDSDSDDRRGRTERTTLYERIRNLSTRERMNVARNGTRAERSVLLKDRNKKIHVFLVQNPRISLDEIRYLSSYRQCNPEALKMISENRIWLQNPAIVSGLVRNPKTPSSVAIRLLDKLPVADVTRIARTGNAPRAVVEAAKRKVLR